MKRFSDVFLLLLAAPFLCAFDPFRSSNSNVEEGNAKLGTGKFKEALEYYEKAVKELPDEPGVHYNLGVALSQLGQLDKAREALLKASVAQERSLKLKSFYNLGNVYYEQKKFKEAAGAYTRALQLSPSHAQSKWNLEMALRRVQEEEKKKKEEEEKKKKDPKQDPKKDKKDQKQDRKDQKQDSSKNQDNPKKKPQPEEKGQKKKDPKQADKEKPRPQPSQQQMNDVLNALDRNDKNLQKQRARALMGQGVRRPEKDW